MEKSERPIIGIDMDQVLVFWQGEGSPYMKKMEELLGGNENLVSIFNMQYWDFADNYPGREDVIRRMYTHPEPGFFEGMPAAPGAIDAVHALMQTYDVIIVTTPSVRYGKEENLEDAINADDAQSRVYAEKLRWVRKHFGPYAPPVIPISDKTFVHCDILIDDNPMVMTNKRHIPSWTHILYAEEYGWNKEIKYPYKMKFDWSNTLELVEKVLEDRKKVSSDRK